jgi:hypothetical protein
LPKAFGGIAAPAASAKLAGPIVRIAAKSKDALRDDIFFILDLLEIDWSDSTQIRRCNHPQPEVTKNRLSCRRDRRSHVPFSSAQENLGV